MPSLAEVQQDPTICPFQNIIAALGLRTREPA
jgi:hypothetical protein